MTREQHRRDGLPVAGNGDKLPRAGVLCAERRDEPRRQGQACRGASGAQGRPEDPVVRVGGKGCSARHEARRQRVPQQVVPVRCQRCRHGLGRAERKFHDAAGCTGTAEARLSQRRGIRRRLGKDDETAGAERAAERRSRSGAHAYGAAIDRGGDPEQRQPPGYRVAAAAQRTKRPHLGPEQAECSGEGRGLRQGRGRGTGQGGGHAAHPAEPC